jgi:hypothetical protein
MSMRTRWSNNFKLSVFGNRKVTDYGRTFVVVYLLRSLVIRSETVSTSRACVKHRSTFISGT